MHAINNWSLWQQTIALLVSLCALIILLTGEYSRKQQETYLHKKIEENKKHIVDTVASTALESIITEDVAALNTIVTRLIDSNNDIVLLRIRNEDKSVLAQWAKPGRFDRKDILSHTESIKYERETFGHIEIAWDLHDKNIELNHHINRTYLINTLALILLTSLILIKLHFLILRPLKDIQLRLLNHAKGVRSNDRRLANSREHSELYNAIDELESLTISKKHLEDEIDQRIQIQEELANARDEAVKATQAKSTFLANMSHEIRTPLTAIIGFSEMLLSKDQSQEDREKSIYTIVKSSKHLLSLINDVLDLSKIESEKIDLEKIETSLFGIVDEVYSLFVRQATDKGLYFQVHYQFPIPNIIVVDPIRVKQILINLCSNAVKFTDNGGIKVEVIYSTSERSVQFIVSDTGIGIAKDNQEVLFEAFTQADASTTRKYGGSGLGLKLTKSLTELMGGKVSVESLVNVGTKFKVIIPADLCEYSEFVSRVQELKPSPAKNSIKASGRVLLVEDNIDNQNLISTMLDKFGIEVAVIDNGKSAVYMALQEEFDLILMDIQMPGMDGLEATRTLRSKGYQGKIVALTANAMLSDQKACLEAGCTEYLSKPIDQDRFNQVIGDSISKSDHH